MVLKPSRFLTTYFEVTFSKGIEGREVKTDGSTLNGAINEDFDAGGATTSEFALKVVRKGVLWEMDTLGFKGNLPNFIKNFLLDRQLKVKVGSVFSTVKEQREGVPQGSVLSVMLFLI